MSEKEFDFAESIARFNAMYNLPVNKRPTLPTLQRLKSFKSILLEEVHELDDIIAKYTSHVKTAGANPDNDSANFNEQLPEEHRLDVLTDLADILGDLVVYIRSEATKYGINLEQSLKIIMDSNFSKLGADGKPLYDERGKVMKGPNYWKPEPQLAEMLKKSTEQ